VKIARYRTGGEVAVGVVEGDVVRALPAGADALGLLALDPRERDSLAARSGEPTPLSEVRLLPPVEPPSIRDFSVFEAHVEGMAKLAGPDATVPDDWYEWPWFYFTNPHAVVGARDPVEVPPGTQALDFELELAAIVGRRGRDVRPEDASSYIAGYTILNDWSARDIGGREFRTGFGQAKGKDFATTLGPWLVTADELEPFRRDGRLALEMRVELNGEPFGRDTSANMAWSFEELVAFSSRGAWVAPGDVIGSGTCGSGCLAELWGRRGRQEPRALAPGDVVTMTVEGIGTIENEVVAGADVVPIPRARAASR
jgi:2-keto-4-pentenoate hydratase/2-oxohepta-3-ene-1,7-dioic acid hydratase in catechol pathway